MRVCGSRRKRPRWLAPSAISLLLAELANTRGAALINLGREARPEFEESLVLAREQGDRGGMATALNNLGSIEVTAGNLDAARLRLQEALAIWRELGQLQSASSAAANLGFTLYRQGDADGAAALFLEVLFTSEREGDPGLRILSLLGLALTCPDDEAAAQRHGAVDALLEQIGYELEHVERPLHDLAKERLRASLGTESFLAAAAAGRAGNGTDAIQLRATQSDRRGSERITDTASYDARLKSAGSGSGSRAGWEQHDDQAVASGTGAHDGGGDCERCRGVGFEWPAPD